MSATSPSLSSWTPRRYVGGPSPSSPLCLKAGTGLEVRRRHHVVPQTDPLARSALRSRGPGGRTPCCSKRRTVESVDAAQGTALTRSIKVSSRGHRGGRGKQLDSAGAPGARAAATRPACSPVSEALCLCRGSGPAGGLSWCGRSMG